jgi:hypothetical protein
MARILPTIEHYKQLELFLFDNDSDKSIQEIEEIPHNIISNVIDQLSQYRFYISPNIYVNKLTLLQFFYCAEFVRGNIHYRYNIFYDARSSSSEDLFSPIPITYLKCFGGGVTRGINEMDFRLLPREHFSIWLKILEKDYVTGSRTFAKYKDMYTTEYNSAQRMRDCFVEKNYALHPHASIQLYRQKKLEEKYCVLEEKYYALEEKYCALEEKKLLEEKKAIKLLEEKDEEIKKLKEYIRNIGI